MLAIALFLAFLLLPVIEIYVIIQVGGLIGAVPTVVLLLAESLLGAWIVRREGRRAWHTLQETFLRGVMPDRELADAALVVVGGAFLLTPGFVTDVVGFLCVLPFTRPLVRRALTAYARHRVTVVERRMAADPGMGGIFDIGGPAAGPGGAGPGGPHGPGPVKGQAVIPGEVIRDGRPD